MLWLVVAWRLFLYSVQTLRAYVWYAHIINLAIKLQHSVTSSWMLHVQDTYNSFTFYHKRNTHVVVITKYNISWYRLVNGTLPEKSNFGQLSLMCYLISDLMFPVCFYIHRVVDYLIWLTQMSRFEERYYFTKTPGILECLMEIVFLSSLHHMVGKKRCICFIEQKCIFPIHSRRIRYWALWTPTPFCPTLFILTLNHIMLKHMVQLKVYLIDVSDF